MDCFVTVLVCSIAASRREMVKQLEHGRPGIFLFTFLTTKVLVTKYCVHLDFAHSFKFS